MHAMNAMHANAICHETHMRALFASTRLAVYRFGSLSHIRSTWPLLFLFGPLDHIFLLFRYASAMHVPVSMSCMNDMHFCSLFTLLHNLSHIYVINVIPIWIPSLKRPFTLLRNLKIRNYAYKHDLGNHISTHIRIINSTPQIAHHHLNAYLRTHTSHEYKSVNHLTSHVRIANTISQVVHQHISTYKAYRIINSSTCIYDVPK